MNSAKLLEFTGQNTELFLETAGKIRWRRKTDHTTDSSDRQLRISQQMAGLLHPDSPYQIKR